MCSRPGQSHAYLVSLLITPRCVQQHAVQKCKTSPVNDCRQAAVHSGSHCTRAAAAACLPALHTSPGWQVVCGILLTTPIKRSIMDTHTQTIHRLRQTLLSRAGGSCRLRCVSHAQCDAAGIPDTSRDTCVHPHCLGPYPGTTLEGGGQGQKGMQLCYACFDAQLCWWPANVLDLTYSPRISAIISMAPPPKRGRLLPKCLCGICRCRTHPAGCLRCAAFSCCSIAQSAFGSESQQASVLQQPVGVAEAAVALTAAISALRPRGATTACQALAKVSVECDRGVAIPV